MDEAEGEASTKAQTESSIRVLREHLISRALQSFRTERVLPRAVLAHVLEQKEEELAVKVVSSQLLTGMLCRYDIQPEDWKSSSSPCSFAEVDQMFQKNEVRGWSTTLPTTPNSLSLDGLIW